MNASIDSVVIGATGYVGGELLRLIADHPTFRLHAAVSSSRAGTPIGELFPSMASHYAAHSFVDGATALDDLPDGSPLAVFSAAPHGASAGVIDALLDTAASKSLEVHVVDVSADFRYANADEFSKVYGIPHAAPHRLKQFRCAVPEHRAETQTPHVGHPGCFATAVLLATVPLYARELIEPAVFVSGITGSTGSGRSPAAGTHHPERHSNLYAYKPLAHRHVPEIEALIADASGQAADVRFVPHSGPFARGIYVTAHARLLQPQGTADILAVLADYYAASSFIQVVDGPPRLKDVVASNRSHVSAVAHDGDVVVMCAIDNLVKGAAGGALQWMNRLWSLPEATGLTAPSPAWT